MQHVIGHGIFADNLQPYFFERADSCDMVEDNDACKRCREPQEIGAAKDLVEVHVDLGKVDGINGDECHDGGNQDWKLELLVF